MSTLSIYKIVNDIDNKVYIGSTFNSLTTRFNNHKSYSNQPKNKASLYNHMREIVSDKFRIELIKTIEMVQPEFYEQQEIDKINKYLLLNDTNAYVDKNEYYKIYYETHKEENKERSKQYYETHKEENRERSKKYYKCKKLNI